MKHFTSAVHNAAHDAAKQMTSDLRRTALEHNWHPAVVRNMRVNYSEGEFKVDIHPEYKDRAFVHEFGDETKRPTAVIRKYEHLTSGAENAFTQQLTKHLGGKL